MSSLLTCRLSLPREKVREWPGLEEVSILTVLLLRQRLVTTLFFFFFNKLSVLKRLFATPMDCSLPGSSVHGIYQATYWSGLPFPAPGDLPNLGMEPPASPALVGRFLTTAPPGKPKVTSRRDNIQTGDFAKNAPQFFM